MHISAEHVFNLMVEIRALSDVFVIDKAGGTGSSLLKDRMVAFCYYLEWSILIILGSTLP